MISVHRVAVLLFASLVSLVLAAPVEAAIPPPSGAGVYWGAEIRGDYGYCPQSTTACDTFESHVTKNMSEIRVTYSVENSNGSCAAVPTGYLETARLRGYLPNMNLALWRLGGGATQSDWQLKDITAGKHDTCLTQTAKAIAAWGHDLWLRPAWEMNINGQFPWQVKGGYNGNAVADYIPAWKHVIDLFRANGATNVSWYFVPNVDPNSVNTPYSSLYPGASYVDWVGLDGYNTGGTTFTARFGKSYDRIEALTGKPFGVAETGSTDDGSVNSQAFISGMFADIAAGRYPQLHLLNWSNYNGGPHDWRLELTAARLDAFKAGIADARYLTGR